MRERIHYYVAFVDYGCTYDVWAPNVPTAIKKAGKQAWEEWAWEEGKNFPLRVRVTDPEGATTIGNLHLEFSPDFWGAVDKES